MWWGVVDGDRKDYTRTKNDKRKNSRNLEQKKRERGGGGGVGWKEMRGNAVLKHYSKN